MSSRWCCLAAIPWCCVHLVSAAFTLPTTSNFGEIQQNHDNTFCFYPLSGVTRSISCGGSFEVILNSQLRQSISIGYYFPDGTRLGGPEWPVPATNPGLIYVCGSGAVGDGTYLSFCAQSVTQDNNVPGGSSCAAAIAQTTVNDGCYTPAAAIASPPPTPSLSQGPSITTTMASLPSTSAEQTSIGTSSSNTRSPSTTGNSNITTTNQALSHSDIIGIAFGVTMAVIAILGLVFGNDIYQKCKDRKREHSTEQAIRLERLGRL